MEDRELNILKRWKWIAAERDGREGGGAAIILNPRIKYVPRNDLFDENLECVWC